MQINIVVLLFKVIISTGVSAGLKLEESYNVDVVGNIPTGYDILDPVVIVGFLVSPPILFKCTCLLRTLQTGKLFTCTVLILLFLFIFSPLLLKRP